MGKMLLPPLRVGGLGRVIFEAWNRAGLGGKQILRGRQVCPREMPWAAWARPGWRGQPALWTWRSCQGVRDGPSPPPAHPRPTLCCRLGTCYSQGQRLGGAQHVPGQAVGPGQLVPGRRGAMLPSDCSAALRLHPQGFRGQLWPSHCSQFCPLFGPCPRLLSPPRFAGSWDSCQQG